MHERAIKVLLRAEDEIHGIFMEFAERPERANLEGYWRYEKGGKVSN